MLVYLRSRTKLVTLSWWLTIQCLFAICLIKKASTSWMVAAQGGVPPLWPSILLFYTRIWPPLWDSRDSWDMRKKKGPLAGSPALPTLKRVEGRMPCHDHERIGERGGALPVYLGRRIWRRQGQRGRAAGHCGERLGWVSRPLPVSPLLESKIISPQRKE